LFKVTFFGVCHGIGVPREGVLMFMGRSRH